MGESSSPHSLTISSLLKFLASQIENSNLALLAKAIALLKASTFFSLSGFSFSSANALESSESRLPITTPIKPTLKAVCPPSLSCKSSRARPNKKSTILSDFNRLLISLPSASLSSASSKLLPLSFFENSAFDGLP